VWIVAALFAIPAIRFKCGDVLVLWVQNYHQHVAIFQLLVSCVLPLCVIAFSNIMTARHIVKTSEEAHNPKMNTRKTTAKVLLVLTLLFVISYLPLHISESYLSFRFKLEHLIAKLSEEYNWFVNIFYTVVIVRCFLLINSCLNPVALLCTSRAFRRHFKRYLTCCCKTKSPPTDFELTRRT
jgi:hypothetical protein